MMSGLKEITTVMPKLKTMESTKLRTPTKELTRIMEGTKLQTPTKERVRERAREQTRELIRFKPPELKLRLPKSSSLLSGAKQKKGKQPNYFKFTEITPVGELLNFNLKKKIKKTKK